MIDHRFGKSSTGQRFGSALAQDEDYQYETLPKYNYMTGIVADVISNPYEYLNRKYKNTEFLLKDVLTGRVRSENLPQEKGKPPDNPSSTFRVGHKDLLDTMPINSVFAYVVDGKEIKDNPKLAICYPFFPGHLSLPLKTGEYVWLLEEKIGNVSYFYWICRKVGHLQIDDLNYTNLERTPAITNLIRNSNNTAGNINIDPAEVFSSEGNVFPAVRSKKNTFSAIAKRSNVPMAMSELLRRSYSHDVEFTGEPVPRIAKNCGDVVIQSSNNAGLHLTTEKFTTLSDKVGQFYAGIADEPPPNRKPNSSAIDMFVSRKKASIDALANLPGALTALSYDDDESKIKAHPNTTELQRHDFVENNKIADIMTSDVEKRMKMYTQELNDNIDDATDVGARLYMSRDCAADSVFGSNFGDLSSRQGPCIITYAEQNRLIADLEARMLSRQGESYIQLDDAGNITAKASKAQGQQFLRLEPGAQGNTTLNAKGTIFLQENAPQSFVRAEDLAVELTKLKSALRIMATALNTGGFCPFPAGPNAVLGGAMSALQTALETPGTAPDFDPATAPWVSKKIKGE